MARRALDRELHNTLSQGLTLLLEERLASSTLDKKQKVHCTCYQICIHDTTYYVRKMANFP